MEIYLVGGAVRDELLGLPVKERDWVVVGATPEALIAQGFQPVGKEFPVFLHPKTHEEYALARTERKVARGYKGFQFYTSPEVTLEEDLIRRDLTINAMARAKSGELIDPFNGQRDLKEKILRHISPAFAEDPVRILRVARFAARFSNFHVYSETNHLMQQMVQAGEVDALVPERVWQEFEKALQEQNPLRFFAVLHDSDALSVLFPEITMNSKGTEALVCATKISHDPVIKFAALCHHIEKNALQKFCHRLRTPKTYEDLARLTAQWFPIYNNPENFSALQILDLLKSVDIFRRPERFAAFLIACKACAMAAGTHHDNKNEKIFNTLAHELNAIDIQSLIQHGYTGMQLANEIQKLRIAVIENLLGTQK